MESGIPKKGTLMGKTTNQVIYTDKHNQTKKAISTTVSNSKSRGWESQKTSHTWKRISLWWWLHSWTNRTTRATINLEKVTWLFKSTWKNQIYLRINQFRNWKKRKFSNSKEKDKKEWTTTAEENKIPLKYPITLSNKKNSPTMFLSPNETNPKDKMTTEIVSISLSMKRKTKGPAET